MNNMSESLIDENHQVEPQPKAASQTPNQAGTPSGAKNEINQQNKEIQSQATISLVNFLLENIFKFKSIIQIKDQSFYVEIPKFGQQNLDGEGQLTNLSKNENDSQDESVGQMAGQSPEKIAALS